MPEPDWIDEREQLERGLPALEAELAAIEVQKQVRREAEEFLMETCRGN